MRGIHVPPRRTDAVLARHRRTNGATGGVVSGPCRSVFSVLGAAQAAPRRGDGFLQKASDTIFGVDLVRPFLSQMDGVRNAVVNKT